MNQEFRIKFGRFKHIFLSLQEILKHTHAYNIGSYLMDAGSLEYDFNMIGKQSALFSAARSSKNVIEIGSYACHSALIILLANDNVKITMVDPCHFSHTKKCSDFLGYVFPGRVNLIQGYSPESVNSIETEDKFDLIHIDGEHTFESAEKDFNACLPLASKKASVVFDDYNFPEVKRYVDSNTKIKQPCKIHGNISQAAISNII